MAREWDFYWHHLIDFTSCWSNVCTWKCWLLSKKFISKWLLFSFCSIEIFVVILKLVLHKTNLKLLPLTYKQGIESIFNVKLKKYMIYEYSCNKNDLMGKGQNYKFHNVKNQKEHQKSWRQSLHRKWLLSCFWVDHNYGITTSKMALELITTSKRMKRTSKRSVLSDFHILTTYGVSTYGIWVLTKTF